MSTEDNKETVDLENRKKNKSARKQFSAGRWRNAARA